jgi:hypothetical protein
MRSPCPGEPPRAALEGFSMHGPARRRPRKTPRDPRCFVCRCYVAAQDAAKTRTCADALGNDIPPRDVHPEMAPGQTCRSAPSAGARTSSPHAASGRSPPEYGHTCLRHPYKVVVMESPNLSVPHQGSSGCESRAGARFGDPTRFRRHDRYGRHLTPTSNRHQQGDDKPQQA